MDRRLSAGSLIVGLLLAASLSASKDASAQTGSDKPADEGRQAEWSGWLQLDAAYAWRSPGHFSNARMLGELAGRGRIGEGVKWKLSARAGVDGAYGVSHHYDPAVRRDQRFEARLHEAYVDFGRGDWEFRLGKQNIVWGEMVGVFVADVVSAKDLRGFILPEFDQIRIPQWAARAEWYGNDTHLELVWLPAPEVDRIGLPGAEFYPAPWSYEGYGYAIEGVRRPERRLSNSGFGIRASTLIDGWDLAAFVYRAPDTQEAFHRSVVQSPFPLVAYEPRYWNTTRVGGTLAKDFDGVVLKAEAVYTRGRRFGIGVLDGSDGVVALDTVDWAVGVDLTPIDGLRVNAQLFQRAYLDYDARIGQRRQESGASLLANYTIRDGLEAEALGISSLDRSDWLLRTMLVWKASAQSRVRLGVDVFGGVAEGQFGRYGSSDRLWAEYRYSF